MNKAVKLSVIFTALLHNVFATPVPKANGGFAASGSVSTSGFEPPIFFKDGTIGVNFLGFKASAGLGGILTGNPAHGGLHAEAETPFGQRAGAGLGGTVDANGRAAGGLYAGATAGGGVGASAGLEGSAGAEGSVGRSFTSASAGGVSKTVVNERFGGSPPAVAASGSAGAVSSASLSGSVNVQKIAKPILPPLTSRVNIDIAKVAEISPPPSKYVQKTITKTVEAVPPPPPPPKETYIERTVIPNYVEKTIQVPTYVEKTIRVPTTVEKKVIVPAPPTIIEKEVEVLPPAPPPVVRTKEVTISNEAIPQKVITRTKTKVLRRPWLRKRIDINNYVDSTPYNGGVVASYGGAGYGAGAGSGAGAYAGGFADVADYYGGNTGTYTATYRKQFNGNLIRDIFNIPIATLGAVSNLVTGIAGGTSGSVSVSKTYSA